MEKIRVDAVLVLHGKDLPQLRDLFRDVLEDTARFYNFEGPQIDLISSVLPFSSSNLEKLRDFRRLAGSKHSENAEIARSVSSLTFDRARLFRFVTENKRDLENLIVLTNVELTPPEGWRYILWDWQKKQYAISIAPMDPAYWTVVQVDDSYDSSRFSTISRRARVACLNVVGHLIGLRGCDNYRCFLRSPVRAVTDLDEMMLLGPEHRISALANKGFSSNGAKPGKIVDLGANFSKG